jgi:hypothetical protein
MVASLPRAVFAIFVVVATACAATPPRVAPGPPIPAEPEIAVDTMTVECMALVASLETWKACKNLEDEDRDLIEAWEERAHLDFAAAEKAKPDAKAQHAIAHNCRRAADSIKAATERCANGKKPRE